MSFIGTFLSVSIYGLFNVFSNHLTSSFKMEEFHISAPNDDMTSNVERVLHAAIECYSPVCARSVKHVCMHMDGVALVANTEMNPSQAGGSKSLITASAF